MYHKLSLLEDVKVMKLFLPHDSCTSYQSLHALMRNALNGCYVMLLWIPCQMCLHQFFIIRLSRVANLFLLIVKRLFVFVVMVLVLVV